MKIHKKQTKRRNSIIIIAIIVAISVGIVIKTNIERSASQVTTPQVVKKTPEPVAVDPVPVPPKPEPVSPPVVMPPPPPGFNRKAYSTTDPSSLWFVANKKHPLDAGYVPSDLIVGASGYTYSAKVDADLRAMLQIAASQDVHLEINSAYRSYSAQANLYSSYVAQYGQASADTFSARPGFSEHQTGLTLDINDSLNAACRFADCSAGTNGAAWLAAHAHEFGFIIRYTKQNTVVTGYQPEPWHVRYVGRALAGELRNVGATSLEEYFEVAGGDYL